MDHIDRIIFAELNRNCRVSYEALGRLLGITANSVKRRIHNLVEDGSISRFVLRFSYEMVDAEPMLALAQVTTTSNVGELIDTIGSHPFVSSVGFDSHNYLVIWVEYVGVEGLAEISTFLRSIDGIGDVELNPLTPERRGKKMVFTRTQMRVIKALLDDPRKPVSAVASEVGMTPKRIRKIISELEESDALWFTVELNPNVGSDTRFVIRLTWDEKSISSTEIKKWFTENYANEYWSSLVCASHPRMFSVFTSEHIRLADEIARSLSVLPSVKYLLTAIPFPAKLFDNIRDIKLREMITSGLD
jgi:Lrp/AsnC family leucine-responsive transcriptional regulator